MSEKDKIPVSINPLYHYCNGVQVIASEEEFLVVQTSGNQVFQFIFSPKHIKRLNMFLEKKIKEYEDKFGELKTELPKTKEQETGHKIGVRGFEDRKTNKG